MNEKSELAYEDYLKGLKYKEIAEKYDVSLSTVKSWASRYWKKKGCNPKEKVATKKKKGAPIGNKNATGPPGNKHAVKTGEFENIFFDTLEEDELCLIKNIEIEKKKLLEQEIQLLTIRERRMLKRIDKLNEANEVVIDTETHGTQGDSEVSLVNYENKLNKIQNIEEALTRVQDKKQKAIDTLHKFEMDEQKLELTVMKLELEIMKQGGQDEEVEDDGFMEALETQVGDAWDD